jgi:hypothetical protein
MDAQHAVTASTRPTSGGPVRVRRATPVDARTLQVMLRELADHEGDGHHPGPARLDRAATHPVGDARRQRRCPTFLPPSRATLRTKVIAVWRPVDYADRAQR